MVPDPGQCQRVQGLQHQGTDATDQHAAEIAMDLPAHRVRPEQAGVALGVFQIEFAQGQTGQAHDLGFDAGADEFHGEPVGASLLAMDVNDYACFLNVRGASEFIASDRASTGCSYSAQSVTGSGVCRSGPAPHSGQPGSKYHPGCPVRCRRSCAECAA
ncbi:hypothetical protein D3C87_1439090 [compost metagenome]